MRGAPPGMKVLRPRSAAEAVSLYARAPQAVPLAGGTDFMVLWNMGERNGRRILDLSAVPQWRGIRKTPAGLRIGALATHADIRDHAQVRAQLPLLAQACAAVGAAQIQNRGTIGGNIANASPAGDTFPALAVYEATVVAVSANGQRSIPFCEVFAGVKKNNLRPAELIAAVEIPWLRKRPDRQLYRKVGTRAAMAISKVVAAGLLWLNPDGTVKELRFALGSVAPTVRRLKSVEEALAGKDPSGPAAPEAGRLLGKDISPIDDIRSTAQYRMRVSRNLLADFLLG